ncbi:MAG TPA: hypothetical protein VI522_07655 [Gammaproteobacteria bacterium]|nr:hypothetical protein [Gammaproteobacteria bacterium]
MTRKSEHNYELEIKKEIHALKDNLVDLKDSYVKQATHMANKVPEAIQKGEDKVVEAVEAHPLKSVGIAAAVGFVMGALFNRK